MVREAMEFVKAYDPELGNMIEAEYKRQQRNIELIASENIVSEAVMAAMGSVLTNKYAEGYPGKRYYGGCECVDEVERLAISRVCEVFGAKFANVQPHSGAQANMAVYFAMLEPGDTVMGMNLSHGGHLTHGSPVNMSGKYFHFVPYGVTEEEEIIRRFIIYLIGRYMGASPKKGDSYSWVPNHLQDANGDLAPRSFLKCYACAAKVMLQNPKTQSTTALLTASSIQGAVQEVSADRVAELKEDFPWLENLKTVLEGETLLMPGMEFRKKMKQLLDMDTKVKPSV